jgi:hypothetical protein
MLDYARSIRQLLKGAACLVALPLCFVLAVQAASAEEMRSFDSSLHLQNDGTLDVTETIQIDFGSARRHGIYRIIPITYNRNVGTYTIELDLKEVTNENGQPKQYITAHQGRFISVRIGDPDATVTGVNTYKLHYLVKRAINFFAGEPEVYWNVTGNEWPYPIDHVTAHLYPPEGTELKAVRAESFVGPLGSTAHGAQNTTDVSIEYQAGKLQPSEGLTIVARFPKGTVLQPTIWQLLWGWLLDWYPVIALPLLTGVALYSYWFFFGRDEDGGKPISVEWDPPRELSPAEVGTLIDESCDLPDITSTIIDLAARGYLKIKKIPYNGILMLSQCDYVFTRTNPPNLDDTLKLHETLTLNGIFGHLMQVVRLSELRGKFYSDIPQIRQTIYDQLVSRKYFSRDPNLDRHMFMCFAVVICIPGMYFSILGGNDLRASGIGFLLSGIIVGLSASAMPRRTALGSKLLRQCKSFQRFVRMAEKDRIRVLAKDDPTVFGRMLPYAMVLGCAEHWAEAFKDLMTAPPEWFESPQSTGGNFTTTAFYYDLFTGMDTMRWTLASAMPNATNINDPPGSSGGGFGGGGGGSW